MFPPALAAGVTEKAWARECANLVERRIEEALVRLEAERVGKRAIGEGQPVRRLLGGILGRKPRATTPVGVPPVEATADGAALGAR